MKKAPILMAMLINCDRAGRSEYLPSLFTHDQKSVTNQSIRCVTFGDSISRRFWCFSAFLWLLVRRYWSRASLFARARNIFNWHYIVHSIYSQHIDFCLGPPFTGVRFW